MSSIVYGSKLDVIGVSDRSFSKCIVLFLIIRENRQKQKINAEIYGKSILSNFFSSYFFFKRNDSKKLKYFQQLFSRHTNI